MTIKNKYYFLSLDLFIIFRIYIYVVIILTFILVLSSTSLLYAIAIPSIITACLLFASIGYIYIDHQNKEIKIWSNFDTQKVKYPLIYEYWWSYNFYTGSLEYVSDMERKDSARSNKVIANLVLKTDKSRIGFKETISLDTRHPNDAKYIQKPIVNCISIFTVQRVDKLMTFLDANLEKSQYRIDQEYIK